MTRAGVVQRMMRDDSQSRAPRPPPGAFGRRRAGTNPGSNRSSMASFDGMNSEELWRLEDSTPDMSNPTRPSQERPLDTVNRMTNRWDPVPFPEALWPTAPMDMPDYLPPPKTKSLTNVTSIRKRGTLRKSASRASTIDNSLAPIPPKDTLSSAHSSATDLSINMNKSQASLSSRPQSMMLGPYGFDLLSTLAPRDGGYAVAAQLSHNNTFSPTSSGGSDRGSFYGSPPPNPHRQSRGPPAPAMMRYDDDLSPPLTGRLSTTTTSSNLSTYSQDEALDGTAPTMTAAHMSLPTMKSPLSQHTTAAEVASMHPPMTPVEENSRREWPVHRQSAAPASMPMGTALAGAGAAGAAAAAAAAGAVGAAGAAGAAGTADAVGAVGGAALTKSKTKKEIKAEEKAKAKASKLEAKREADRREQEAARQKTAAAKEAAHQREEKAKEAARVKAEDKARAKADKSSRRQSMFGLSSRSTSASAPTASSDPPLAMQPAQQPAQQQRATAPQAASQARPPVSPQATPQVRAPVPPQMPVAPVVPAKDGPVRDGTVMPNGVPNGSAAPVPNGNVPNGSAIGRGPPPAIVVPPRMSSNRCTTKPLPRPNTRLLRLCLCLRKRKLLPPSSQQLSNGPESRSMPRPNLSPQPSHLNAGPRKNGPTPQQSLPPTPMSSSNSTTPSAASMVASRARTPSAVSMTPSSAQSATSSSLTPTNAATDSGSATSTAPKQKKSGLSTTTLLLLRSSAPVSMAVGGEQNQQRNVSAPPAPPVHRAPVAAAPPVTRPQLNSLPPTPPSKDHSPVVKASKPATRTVPIPPPVIVPPRQSSLARGPEQHSDAEDADHHRQASLSDPSSVVVTPTTSRATNSSPSLFEVRPHAMREDNAWEGGYESAVSDASGKPLRHDMVPAMERPVPSLAAH
ncbi:hypothetical protein CcaverHIS002_0112700 [Cutaneotrichosporon cavernicola]|nr:hypothetical protein CcaverHIS002_0112700 [Cutaneotrichosporon cavernicola]